MTQIKKSETRVISFLLSPDGILRSWHQGESSHAETIKDNSPEYQELLDDMLASGISEGKALEYVVATAIGRGWVRAGIIDLGTGGTTLFIESNNLDSAKKFLEVSDLEKKGFDIDKISFMHSGITERVAVPSGFEDSGEYSDLVK